VLSGEPLLRPEGARSCRKVRLAIVGQAGAMAGLLAAAPVHGQTAAFDIGLGAPAPFQRNQGETAGERRFEDYDARPVPVGTFLLGLEAAVTAHATDNLLARRADRRSDASAAMRVNGRLQSNWGRHAVQAFGSAALARYARLSSEDNETYEFGASGRLDGPEGSNLQFGGETGRYILSRLRDRGALQPLVPVAYRRHAAYFGAVRTSGRFRLGGSIDWTGSRYAAGGTGKAAYPDRDRLGLNARADYAVSADASVFLTARHVQENFRRSGGAVDRDACIWQGTGGLDFILPGWADGQLSVGYVRQTFRDPAIRDFQGLTYQLRARLIVTPLIAVTAEARRTLDDTPLLTAAGLRTDSARVTIAYELKRNIVLTPSVGYAFERYRDAPIAYRRFDLGLNAAMKFNPHWEMQLALTHARRRVAAGPADAAFTVNNASISTIYHF